MKTLVFDWSVSGHRLEFIHHFYSIALTRKTEDFIFLVPKEFESVKEKFHWEDSDNIEFQYLSEVDQNKCDMQNLLVSAWYKSLIVRRYVNKYKIDKIWLSMLMFFMPFLPFVLSGKVKVSGIVYRLYLYDGGSNHGIRLWLEKLRYLIMSISNCMDRIFILNDEIATEELNRIYHTHKFHYLPDPIPVIDDTKVIDLRPELGAKVGDVIFLHFGGLDVRKGTLEILKAILEMQETVLENKIFVFAGRISESMKHDFYALYHQAKEKCRIIVQDEFCSYEHLNNLCYSCNHILIPYKNVNQSSGVIGYAAHFKKTVVGPSAGLLGNLIKNYDLGTCVEIPNSASLAKVLCSEISEVCISFYEDTHTVDDFCKAWL